MIRRIMLLTISAVTLIALIASSQLGNFGQHCIEAATSNLTYHIIQPEQRFDDDKLLKPNDYGVFFLETTCLRSKPEKCLKSEAPEDITEMAYMETSEDDANTATDSLSNVTSMSLFAPEHNILPFGPYPEDFDINEKPTEFVFQRNTLEDWCRQQSIVSKYPIAQSICDYLRFVSQLEVEDYDELDDEEDGDQSTPFTLAQRRLMQVFDRRAQPITNGQQMAALYPVLLRWRRLLRKWAVADDELISEEEKISQ